MTVATVTPADTYIDSVLAILNDMSIDKTIQANCMYLCGYYHIARGNVLRVRDRGRGRERERERERENGRGSVNEREEEKIQIGNFGYLGSRNFM